MRITLYVLLFMCFCANSHSCNICECSAKRELFQCDCTRTVTKKNCDKLNNIFSISSEQLFLPSNIYVEKMEDLNVHDISLHIFYISETKLPSIKRFSLVSCNTTMIDKKSFVTMNSLTFLTLENNMIAQLDGNIFASNNKLENINLSNNYIIDLPHNLFWNLNNLKRINLSMNKIKNLKQNVFLQNKYLQNINLSNNHIQELPNKVFHDLPNIISIHLQNNDIQILPAGIFKNLTNLRLVNLSNNNLISITTDAFNMNSNLEKLYLSNNKITSIPSNVIGSLKKLNYFELENNLLDCDCKMKNFISAYKVRDISGHISCLKPDNLALKHFSSISIEDLVCPPRINNCTEIKLSKDSVKIACEIFGYPIPAVRWTFTENVTCTDCYQMSFSSINNEKYWTNLTIFDVSVNSKQMYKINISNNAGSDQYVHNKELNNTFNLITTEVFGQSPKIIDCVEGVTNVSNSVIISCSVLCHSEPKCIWSFNKMTHTRYNMSIDQKANNIYLANLTIYNVSSNSEGIYVLYTENQYGGSQHLYNLKINNTVVQENVDDTSKIKSPLIETRTADPNKYDKNKDVLDIERISHEITEDDKPSTNTPNIENNSNQVSSPKVRNCIRNPFEGTITISCQIFGNPTPRATWTYRRHKINNNNNYYRNTFETVDDYQHCANLTILYVSSDTSGIYTIEVTNEFGSFHYSESVQENAVVSVTVSLIIICGILLVILLFIICWMIIKTRHKIRTSNMKHDLTSETSSFNQEEIFSTNDSRIHFTPINLVAFHNEFNTVSRKDMGNFQQTTSNSENNRTPLIQANRANSNTNNNNRIPEMQAQKLEYSDIGHTQTHELSPLMNKRRNTIDKEDTHYLPDE